MKYLSTLLLVPFFFILFITTNFSKAIATAPYLPTDYEEKILNFDSKIEILSDNELHVTENIQVNAMHKEINHGIYRDFPTEYSTTGGFKTHRNFRIKQVMLDAVPTTYRTEDIAGGIRTYIGSSSYYVPIGIHTYTIEYYTDRQITFGENNTDTLNFNITGNGWAFTIDNASADIYFPIPVDTDKLSTTAYVGKTGSREKSYSARIRDDGNHGSFIHIETTRILDPHEGLTVEIEFPKEIITSSPDSIGWFIQDNSAIIVAIYITLMIFILCYYLWRKYGNDDEIAGTIIPEYDAPDNLSAGALRFLNKRSIFDNKIITSLIVGLAMKKYINISKTESDEYLIKQIKEIPSKDTPDYINLDLPKEEKIILEKLFEIDSSLIVAQSANRFLRNIVKVALTGEEIKTPTLPIYNVNEAIGINNPIKSKLITNDYDKNIATMTEKVRKSIEQKVLDSYYKRNLKYTILPAILSLIALLLVGIYNGLITDTSNFFGFAVIGFFVFSLTFNIGRNITQLKTGSITTKIGMIMVLVIIVFILEPFIPFIFGGIKIIGLTNHLQFITNNLISIAVVLCVITTNILFFFAIPTRTKKGTEIQRKIEGLKLFLSTVEQRRYESDLHKDIPHTLDVYEKYLPYAIALDVDPVWTLKFRDVIDQAMLEPNSSSIHSGSFIYSSGFSASDFSSSFTSTISSASVAPSSSGSGFSGGGGSGGGGGGGGGGGW